MPQTLEGVTLRDRIVAAVRLNRELVEHLDQGFIPKTHSLRRITRPESPDVAPAGDRTVHQAAAAVLEADNYTVGVYEQLIAHCESICEAVHRMTQAKPDRHRGE